MRVIAILVSAIVFYLLPDSALETIFSKGYTACQSLFQLLFDTVSNLIK